MATGVVETVTLQLTQEEIERDWAGVSGHRGRSLSAESQAAIALAVGQGIVYSPCPDHSHAEGHRCRTSCRVVSLARRRGFKLQTWHHDGALVILRIS